MRECLEAEASLEHLRLGFLGVEWAGSETVDEDAFERTLSWAADYDAMVLLSGVFSHGVSGLSRFAQRWSPRPVVSVGYRLPGVPSLLVDNRAATRLATAHLIQAHQKRSLLFLRGRKDSQESEERYLGFRHALRDHGILFDERWLLTGDFTRRGALRALSTLAPQVAFDAVVAGNDDMALAVMSDLKRKGVRVPEDVAVIGFDDVPEARAAAVPLASLAQPFQEMARRALGVLRAQADGSKVEAAQLVPVKLITRASCGCS